MLGLILHDRKHVGYSRERGEYTARLDVLKLRQDAIRTAVAAVIDEVVSVPPSSAGSHLDKPGPDVMRRATNGDGVIDRADGLGNQAVSGKSPGLLASSRADLHAAVSRKCREDYQCSGEHNQYFPFHSHANRKGSPVELSSPWCKQLIFGTANGMFGFAVPLRLSRGTLRFDFCRANSRPPGV